MADDSCSVSPLLPRRSIAGVVQDELVDPKELADADGCFCEFNGVDLHHKICSAGGEDAKVAGIRVPAVLLHGFGASAFSWDRVMQPLGRMVMADVLAFDRPAFGLTSRTAAAAASSGLNPYSMVFSVLATLFFIDRLAAEKKGEKALLIGHSAGCFVAVETYFKSPEKVAALVLVSPAIFAPVASGRIGKERLQRNRNVSRFLRFLKALTDLRKQLVCVIFAVLKAMRAVAGSLFVQAVLTKFLRSSQALMLVRMIVDKFGISAIRVSWFDQSKITDYVIQGYTKPLKAKGWEMAFLEYALALLTPSSSSSSSSKSPLSERLAQISCPVLIITGDSDRVVPAWNAKRLSLAIPGSRLEVIEECGHLPHEEKVEEFLMIVEKFLGRAFAVSDQPQSVVDAPYRRPHGGGQTLQLN